MCGVSEIFLLSLIVLFWIFVCCTKRNRTADEANAHADLPRVRQTMSQRRSAARQQPAQAEEEPEEQPDRSEVVKSALFSRKLGEGENIGSMRSILVATRERLKDESSSERVGNIAGRSWRAASVSTRTLTRNECTICLDQYEEGDTVCWAKKEECDHIFHEECISHWLQDHDECPLCRTNIVKKEEGEAAD
uniref:RING-type domain-containing protein n=1 Tax=Trieres chinensis TaxID=1514140 RepID=A0A7S2EWX5_TRICV